MYDVRVDLNKKVLQMEKDNLISKNDRLLITGIAERGGIKHSPVFRAVTPYPYPLFKIHKCTPEQFEANVKPYII